MYKKLCLGLLLGAGVVSAMDGDVPMDAMLPTVFGPFATPPSSPGRLPRTPNGPVKVDFASRVAHAQTLYQIFLNAGSEAEKSCAADDARECARACLNVSPGSESAEALRGIIANIDNYFGRAVSPTIYVVHRPAKRLTFPKKITEDADSLSSSDSDSSDDDWSDESM